MSIRNPEKGYRRYALSHDKGASWSKVREWKDLPDPACNGDLLATRSAAREPAATGCCTRFPPTRPSGATSPRGVELRRRQSWPCARPYGWSLPATRR